MSALEVDVEIVGGGFGGSLLAMALRRAGLRIALIDRGRHPRFAIGESSTPIANLVLQDLCREYDLPNVAPLAKYGLWQATHPQLVSGIKRGFTYFHQEAGQPFVADAQHSTELLVTASSSDQHSDTHWLRQDVDEFLFREASVAGAACFEDCEVAEIDTNGHDITLRLVNASLPSEEESRLIQTRFVVDGSGEGQFLAKRLRIQDLTHELRTNSRTVFAHFANVTRWKRCLETRGIDTTDHPFDCDHAALHHVFEGGWMWQLRFNDETVSAGFVQDLNRGERPDLSAAAEWESWLRRFPAIGEQFANAKIVRPKGGLRSTGRLQRKLARAVGSWWAMLPNTAGFIDALHSTGIAHTLCGIERLGRTLIRSLGRDNLEPQLREYERCVLAEVEMIDLLVSGCFAAMGDFQRFATATMLYFAAATSYERARLASVGEFRPAFLLADDNRWVAVVRRMCDRLRETGNVKQFEREMVEAIRPFNVVGLCDPASRNMFRHSAMPEY